MAVKFNKNFNVNRLIRRIMYLIIGLLVGGLILSAFITAFKGYCSVLFNGLSIIGVNVTTGAIYDYNLTQSLGATVTPQLQSSCYTSSYVVGNTGNLNSGILTVVGVIGVAGIIMTEFVRW